MRSSASRGSTPGTVPCDPWPMTRTVISVERVIPAPAERIFPLIADPARHRDIDGSGTVRDAKNVPSEPLHLGSTFGMHMKVGIPYSMVNTVIEYEANRRIAWQTRPPTVLGKLLRWADLALRARARRRRHARARDVGLRRGAGQAARVRGAGEHTREAMEQTLERIATLVTG